MNPWMDVVCHFDLRFGTRQLNFVHKKPTQNSFISMSSMIMTSNFVFDENLTQQLIQNLTDSE